MGRKDKLPKYELTESRSGVSSTTYANNLREVGQIVGMLLDGKQEGEGVNIRISITKQ